MRALALLFALSGCIGAIVHDEEGTRFVSPFITSDTTKDQ